jgi:Zn-dependent protease with chaperone function
MNALNNRFRQLHGMKRRIAQVCVLTIMASPVAARAICESVWDGDKLVSAISGRQAHLSIPLRDKQQRVTTITVDQLQAFNEAKERVYRVAGLSPKFIICDGAAPNAFAFAHRNTDFMAVTPGMLRLVNGDRDMAAAVVGHELGHHTRQHMTTGAARDALVGLAGILLGVAVDARQQRRTGIYTGLGVQFGQIGSTLLSRKFDRDQEREADDIGFQYLVAAGFDPNGAVRLSERMNRPGGSTGLFFDSHPGWTERADRFRTMIASSPQAQQLVARGPTVSTVSSIGVAQSSVATPHHTIATVARQPSGDGQMERSDVPRVVAGLAIQTSIGNEYRDMMTAVMLSDQSAVNDFLTRGVDINELRKGTTYLIAAVMNKDLEMVKYLISKGADVNRPDNRGLSPIVYAKAAGPATLALTQFLEENGAHNPFAHKSSRMQATHIDVETVRFESY